jgi:hypothetical protein
VTKPLDYSLELLDALLSRFGSDYCSGNTAEMWRDRAEFIRISVKKAIELNPGA